MEYFWARVVVIVRGLWGIRDGVGVMDVILLFYFSGKNIGQGIMEYGYQDTLLYRSCPEIKDFFI